MTMEEKNTQIIIKCLAEKVRSLEVDTLLLRSENTRLREKITMYEKNTEEAGKNNA